MPLILADADLRRFHKVSQVILGAEQFDSALDWCRMVAEETKGFIGADTCAAALPSGGRLTIYTENPAGVEYVPQIRSLDRRLHFLKRAVELGAYDRSTLFAPYREEYLRSEYYRGWALPNRFCDCVGLAVRTGPADGPLEVAQLILHLDRPTARFGERAAAMISLLLPSFRAGVSAWRAREQTASPSAATGGRPITDIEQRARAFGLTAAQARVARLLADGLSNEEIAEALFISPATARNHTARVREKLGVRSRAKVAALILNG